MERFEIVKQIGDGSFGSVFKAINKKNKEVVAIKRMKQKYYSWEQCMQLREVSALRKLNNHPNIVKLKEVIREQTDLFFIFEYMDAGDLLSLMKQNTGSKIAHTRIRNIMFQVLQSLCYIHRQGYFHRDMKPENILLRMNPAEDYVVKIADFGLAKEVRCKPPLTDYVSTRWYRAPEVLLQDKTYNSPIDLWACGCIIAELYMLRPLFPGTSEVDELFKITSVLGTPTEQTFPEGLRMAKQMRYTFPVMAATPLVQILPRNTPSVAIDFMEKLMCWDPKNRMTAAGALQHAYFTVMVDTDDIGIPNMAAAMPKKMEREAISAPPTTMNSPHDAYGSQSLPNLREQGRVASRGTQPEKSTPNIGNTIPFTQKPLPPTGTTIKSNTDYGDILSGPSSNKEQDKELASLLGGARYVVGKSTIPSPQSTTFLPSVGNPPPTLSALTRGQSFGQNSPAFGNNGQSPYGGAYGGAYGGGGPPTYGGGSVPAYGGGSAIMAPSWGPSSGAQNGGPGGGTTSITGMRKPSWGTSKFPMNLPAVKKAPS